MAQNTKRPRRGYTGQWGPPIKPPRPEPKIPSTAGTGGVLGKLISMFYPKPTEEDFPPQPRSNIPNVSASNRWMMANPSAPNRANVSTKPLESFGDGEEEIEEIVEDEDVPTPKRGKDVHLPSIPSAKSNIAGAAPKKKINKSFDIPSLKLSPLTQLPNESEHPEDYLFPEQVEEEKPNRFMESYSKHLDSFPNREDFKPGVWAKIAGTLQALGGQDPHPNLNRRYSEAVEDWAMREEPMRRQVELDYKMNNPMNDLKYQNIQSQIQNRTANQDFSQQRINNSARFINAKIQAMERQGFQKVVANDGEVYMVRGDEIIPTGITALEYARLQESQFVNRQRLRQGNQSIQLRERNTNALEFRNRALYGSDIEEIDR